MKSRDNYYKKRLDRHTERAEYHADMADKGIHTEHHREKEAYHRKQAEKVKAKMSKDTGPMTSMPSATGSF